MCMDNPAGNNKDRDERANQPSNDQDIVEAINSVKSAYECGEKDRTRHDDKVLQWTKIMTGVVVTYTVLTGFITCSSINSAKQAAISADAARRAATIANETLHLSERAYVVFGTPHIDTTKKDILVQFVNTGHIPSGPVSVTAHEATFNVEKPGAKTQFFRAIEKSWQTLKFSSVSPGIPMGIVEPTPAMSPKRMSAGLQGVVVAGNFSYTDGFPHTPVQKGSFCVQTRYQLVSKEVYLSPCDATYIIPQMVAVDGYPKHDETN